jgi:hypothetical protein
MAWYSRFLPATAPAPSQPASSGVGQLAPATSFHAGSINPHPHWFNSQIVNDGVHAPTLRRFAGMGPHQAGVVPTSAGFDTNSQTNRGATPMTGQG